MVSLLDTHQHLIYRANHGYQWTSGIPALAEGDFTARDYRSAVGDGPVIATLFMETGVDDADYKSEARTMTELARDPDSGICGVIASCRPETDEGFDAWLDACGQMGVKGYRRILHVVEDERSRSATFRRNLKKIGARGLSFDLCFLARQLPVAAELARACDEQWLVLDHCGVAGISEIGFEAWKRNISSLAAMPHVCCKVSGALTYCLPRTAEPALIQRHFDHVLEAFGPDRLVWGSDWPVLNTASSVGDRLSMTVKILSMLSADDVDAIGHKTGARIYRVGLD